MKKILVLIATIMFIGINAGARTITNTPICANDDNKQSDLTTVIFSAHVHCDGCKKKIEKNMAFEKGVKEIKVDIDSKTVTITFKNTRNTPEKLSAALTKLGYENKIMIIK